MSNKNRNLLVCMWGALAPCGCRANLGGAVHRTPLSACLVLRPSRSSPSGRRNCWSTWRPWEPKRPDGFQLFSVAKSQSLSVFGVPIYTHNSQTKMSQEISRDLKSSRVLTLQHLTSIDKHIEKTLKRCSQRSKTTNNNLQWQGGKDHTDIGLSGYIVRLVASLSRLLLTFIWRTRNRRAFDALRSKMPYFPCFMHSLSCIFHIKLESLLCLQWSDFDMFGIRH